MRYKVITGSQSCHCCFGFTVVDTSAPLMIGEKQYNDQFEAVWECFILLLNLAEMAGVDLVTEARRKMEINRKRKWGAPDADGVCFHVKQNIKTDTSS